MGPEALRVAGLHAALMQRGLDVVDCGNVGGPPNPGLIKVNGYRNLAQVTAWNLEVHDAVYRELREQRLPILLGGDHSLSIGSISAVARHCRDQRKSLRVLWLDAHADFNTRELSPSGSLHGMPVSCLCGFGPRELTADRRRRPPPSARSGCARSEFAASMPASGVSCTSRISKCSTCAASTNGRETGHGAGACRTWMRTPICT